MMNKNEIIERLERLAKHAVHTVGEPPFVMSLDDGIAIHEAIDMLRSQPEQSEIIHCRDCKHKYGSCCDNFAEVWVNQNDYCSRAERKEDNNETN